MEQRPDNTICILVSWGIAAVAGLVVLVVLMVVSGWTFLQGAFIGLIAAGAIGVFNQWAFCRPLPGPVSMGTPAAAAPLSQPAGTAPAASPAPAAAPAVPQPAATAAPDPGSTPAPDAQPAAPAADSQPAKPEAEEGTKPADLMTAPQGAADDLKRISGVGPKLEEKLNGMGVWHYWQIAKWGPDEVAWVDSTLKFRGRIERDGWIEQARALAAGKAQG